MTVEQQSEDESRRPWKLRRAFCPSGLGGFRADEQAPRENREPREHKECGQQEVAHPFLGAFDSASRRTVAQFSGGLSEGHCAAGCKCCPCRSPRRHPTSAGRANVHRPALAFDALPRSSRLAEAPLQVLSFLACTGNA
jgi:hypothetical protein